MVINTVTEASGLIIGSLFWVVCKANSSKAGSGSIDVSRAMRNLVIMLFGELVISDTVVAYLSYKFASRYVISIAHEWEGFKATQRRALSGLIVLVSLMSIKVFISIPQMLCLTSLMPDEENWALTQCPPIDDELRNMTNLVRVDDVFLTEWGDIT